MLTALVTGGAGFVGRHLCARLLAMGRRVVCVDNFYTGSYDNIAEFAKDSNFSLLQHDVSRPLHVAADEIYNLACPASPVHYQREPLLTIQTSVLGAMRILDLAQRTGAKVLQASTSEVYGDPSEHPQRESYWGHVNPVGVRACYDEGKRCAEALFFDHHRCEGTRIKVARIFNTYGPYMQMDDGRVVSNFIVQALRGDPLTIYGDGTQTRSFCYVDDLVEGLIRLMESGDDVIGPFNLGNPDEFSVEELARQVLAFTGSRSKIEYHPLPSDDPRQRRPDISKASEVLAWEPYVDVKTGLQETIRYFMANIGREAGVRMEAS